jgi:hypothetical protein
VPLPRGRSRTPRSPPIGPHLSCSPLSSPPRAPATWQVSDGGHGDYLLACSNATVVDNDLIDLVIHTSPRNSTSFTARCDADAFDTYVA